MLAVIDDKDRPCIAHPLLPVKAPRARVYKDYSWPNSYWGKDVIPESQGYTVLGPIWDRDSWVDYDPLRTAPDPLPN
jgi:hypothetical protein